MKVIWDKYKWWIIIALLLVVIGICIYIYFAILKTGKSQGLSLAIATIPNPANDEDYTDAERAQIGQLNNQIKNEFSGFMWSTLWSDYTPLTTLSVSPSRIQIGVCNQYKEDRPGSDLITDINSLNSLNYDFDLMRTTLVGQLQQDLNQTSPSA
jgi:hypothetical protein